MGWVGVPGALPRGPWLGETFPRRRGTWLDEAFPRRPWRGTRSRGTAPQPLIGRGALGHCLAALCAERSVPEALPRGLWQGEAFLRHCRVALGWARRPPGTASRPLAGRGVPVALRLAWTRRSRGTALWLVALGWARSSRGTASPRGFAGRGVPGTQSRSLWLGEAFPRHCLASQPRHCIAALGSARRF